MSQIPLSDSSVRCKHGSISSWFKPQVIFVSPHITIDNGIYCISAFRTKGGNMILLMAVFNFGFSLQLMTDLFKKSV